MDAAQLREASLAYRAGDDEAIHDLRVAARRLRVTRPDLMSELRWLGNELGPLRDATVLRDRFQRRLAAQDRALTGSTLDAAPARRLIEARLSADIAAARQRADSALRGDRFSALLAALDADCQDAAAVRPRLGKARDRLRIRITAAQTTLGEEREEALHRVRKAAKQLRYAADRVGKVKLARRAQQVQRHLGDHQDATVARALLADLIRSSPQSAMSAAVLGRIDVVEHRAADRAAAYARKAITPLA